MLPAGRLGRAAVALAAIAAGAVVYAQNDVDVLQIRPNAYMIAGAGANVTVQFGGDGAVVVDAGTVDRADQVIAAIKKITTQPIRYVIDTSADPDHVAANEKIAKAGKKVLQTNNAPGAGTPNGGEGYRLAREQVLKSL